MSEMHRAGFVTIVGRPNVGKSTMLNAILGQKIAIVTAKPQTTRDRIVGVCPIENGQLIFVDTPGVHRAKKALNKHMREVAMGSIGDVDAVIVMLDANFGISRDDREILDAVELAKKPALAVLNKVDRVPKQKLLPLMAALHETGLFSAIIPISALKEDGLDTVLAEAAKLVPEGPALYGDDELTDKPVRFLVAELLREELMKALADELPYSIGVEITRYKRREDRPLVDIDATIHVERKSQKGIVLGKGGERMKAVNAAARAQIEALIDSKVFLRVHVRVEPNWTTSAKGLKKLGYTKTS